MRFKLCLLATLFTASAAYAAQTTVELKEATAKGDGKAIGEVVISETEYGLLFTPKLSGLQAGGVHGFHVHENPSCDPGEKEGKTVPALKAGGDNYSDHPEVLGGGGARMACGIIPSS
ncbi:TPA: hypothetical protein ACS772_000995 [Providencia alcalifaciens]